jgi:SAM-dependent methyltransferase
MQFAFAQKMQLVSPQNKIMKFKNDFLKGCSTEPLKPIPVISPKLKPVLFYIRCLFDLQLKTIVQFLSKELINISNNILDIGAGNSPWKSFLRRKKNSRDDEAIEYVGLDITHAMQFNMNRNDEIVYYSGNNFPFSENEFNNALCIEVLEHVLDTEIFLQEIYRCLKPNGKLILTIPWSARRHYVPYDFFRFTPEALFALFKKKGFIDIKIDTRGNDFAVIFNKILCLIQSLFFPQQHKIKLLLSLPLGITLLPSLLFFFLLAHLTMLLGIKSYFDPLGFTLIAKKPDIS